MSAALHKRIVAFCQANGISISSFGRLVSGDPTLVPAMKAGRKPGEAMVFKIEQLLTSAPADVAARLARVRRTVQQVAAVKQTAAMLATKARNDAANEAGDLPTVPSNPDVLGLGGAFCAAGGAVLLQAFGGQIFLAPSEAEKLGQRLIGLAQTAVKLRPGGAQ